MLLTFAPPWLAVTSDALSRHDSGYGSVDLSKEPVAGPSTPPLIKIEFFDSQRIALERAAGEHVKEREKEEEERAAEGARDAKAREGRRLSGLVVKRSTLAAEQKRVSSRCWYCSDEDDRS